MSVYHRNVDTVMGRIDPEDGPQARRLWQDVRDDADRAIIGFACEAGVIRNKGRPGAKLGPAAIRNAMANLPSMGGLEFADLGDIVVDGDDLEHGQEMLSDRVANALATKERLMVLGGGHETAFGSHLGLKQRFSTKRIGIINLDAHLDLRNPGDAGPSSGTPFNQIRNLDPDRFNYLCIGVAEEANTQALFERAKVWGVDFVLDREMVDGSAVFDEKIRLLIERSDIVHLSIDIDVLPHYQAPGVSAPAVRGVPFATIEHILTTVDQLCEQQNTPMPLVDIVEVSPPYDRDGITAKTAAYLARYLL